MAEPGEPILWSLYVYAPNKGAPIFFMAAYALSGVFHLWQCARYKAWKLAWLHPACAVFFTIGYAFREYGAYNYLYSTETKMTLILFILSQVFIYICPPFLELANYHVLGHVFHYVPYLSPFPPNRVLSTFGGLMMLVEALNAVGVALATNPTGSSTALGKNLTVAAIAIQVVVIVIFVCLAAVFHVRFIARCRRRVGFGSRRVRTMLLVLYASMALIFARCLYRLVEHTGHTKVDLDDIESLRGLSPLLRHEVYFLVFESTLMLVNSWLWNVWHPGRFLPRDRRVYLAEDGTEAVADKGEDSRPLLAKAANVFTFGVLFRDKEKKGQQYRMQSQSQSEHGPASGYSG